MPAVRSRLRRHWRSTIAVAVLVGLAGGVVLASLAGARRVETAYDRLLTDIDAYDFVAATCDETGCHTADVQQQLTESGLVESIAAGVVFQLPALTTVDGRPLAAPGSDDPCGTGDHERAIWAGPGAWGPGGRLPMRVEEGRAFDPNAMEILVPRIVAERVGLAAGDTLLLVGPCRGDGPVPWAEPLHLTVAGIGVGPLDIDTPTVEGTFEILLGSPAVMAEIDRRGWTQVSRTEGLAIWAAPGVPVEEIIGTAGLGESAPLFLVALRAAQIRADLEPDASTLRLLALLTAVASALVLAPLIARQLRLTSGGEAVLPALGATRRQRAGYGLAYAALLSAVGAVLAVVVSHAVSHWVPRGLAESIEADPGWILDPTMVVLGVPAIATATVALAALPAWRAAAVRSVTPAPSPGAITRFVATLHLGPAGSTGLRAALGSRSGERALAVRRGSLALAVALGCVAGAQTFSAGLSGLLSTPRLVGWGWDAVVYLDEGGGRLEELERAPGVERVTAGTIWLLGEGATLAARDDEAGVVPRAFATGAGAITPVVTDGRAAEGADELVVAQTLADSMGVEVGDQVELAVPDPARTAASMNDIDVGADEADEWERRAERYEVVGVGPLVRFGAPLSSVALTLDGLARLVVPTAEELSALAGQLGLDEELFLDRVDPGLAARPQVAWVDLEGGPGRALDVLGEVVGDEVIAPSDGASVINSLELIDLSRAGRVPDVLGGLFAVVSVGVLAVLVAGGVRGRRRDLAVLRALGMSNGQVRASVAWQASLQVIVPVAIGVPLGVIVGQRVWRGYAESIGVVPATAIGWPYLLALVAAALVLANAVALMLAPGTVRHLSRSLRSE
jgi:FtsX-like permease family